MYISSSQQKAEIVQKDIRAGAVGHIGSGGSAQRHMQQGWVWALDGAGACLCWLGLGFPLACPSPSPWLCTLSQEQKALR